VRIPFFIKRDAVLLPARDLYNIFVIQTPDRDCRHRENPYSSTTRFEEIFSLGSLSMSNPVLFPVAMCSPVRPFPSCPFSPLPQAYTVKCELSSATDPGTSPKKGHHVLFPCTVRNSVNVMPAAAATMCSCSPVCG
jgi:hypothetical protein